jgi:hypothetical protein
MTRYNTRNAKPTRPLRKKLLSLNRRKMAVLELLEDATLDVASIHAAKAGSRFPVIVLRPWPENASLKGPRVQITLQEVEVTSGRDAVNLLGQIKDPLLARFGRGENAFDEEPIYEKDGWVHHYARAFADRYGYVVDQYEDLDKVLRPDHEAAYQRFKLALTETLAVGTMIVYRNKVRNEVCSILAPN